MDLPPPGSNSPRGLFSSNTRPAWYRTMHRNLAGSLRNGNVLPASADRGLTRVWPYQANEGVVFVEQPSWLPWQLDAMRTLASGRNGKAISISWHISVTLRQDLSWKEIVSTSERYFEAVATKSHNSFHKYAVSSKSQLSSGNFAWTQTNSKFLKCCHAAAGSFSRQDKVESVL